MIKCEKKDLPAILSYIGNDYGKCAYLYIDLKKYGIDHPEVEIWYQPDENGKICLIMLRYYNGMHAFSQTGAFDAADAANLASGIAPAMLCGMEQTIDPIAPYLADAYEPEIGHVLRLAHYNGKHNPDAYKAGKEDYADIARLLSEDEVMGGPYGYELLYRQLIERFEEGFGRSWVLRDEKGVAANSATYAELSDIAVVSGGIVRPDRRGEGLYSKQIGSLCRDLTSEGKEVISYAYGGSAEGAHYSVGFEKLGIWKKLIRIK